MGNVSVDYVEKVVRPLFVWLCQQSPQWILFLLKKPLVIGLRKTDLAEAIIGFQENDFQSFYLTRQKIMMNGQSMASLKECRP